MRATGGTNFGLAWSVVAFTNSTIACLAGPSFQEGSGSVCAWAATAVSNVPHSTSSPKPTVLTVFIVDSFRRCSFVRRFRHLPPPSARRSAGGPTPGRPRPEDQQNTFVVLLAHCRPGRRDFRFHGIEIEAGALLHRRVLDGRHDELLHLLLDKHEAPEFVFEPLEVLLRPGFGPTIGPARALERIQAKVGQVGHVRNQSSPEMMPFSTLPAGTLPGQRIIAGARKPPSMIVPFFFVMIRRPP